MTRWELIQAFRKLARILFVEAYHNEDDALLKVKALVIDVLTESDNDLPVKFGADENKGV